MGWSHSPLALCPMQVTQGAELQEKNRRIGELTQQEVYRTVASSLEVVRPYCVVITTTPTSAHSLVQVPHKCGTAMAVPAL